MNRKALNIATLLVSCLLLVSCGSSGSQQDYHIKLFAVNISCEYAAVVQDAITDKMQAAGIPFSSDLTCVDWSKSYEFGETEKALAELSSRFGKGHFLVNKFGNYFDGVATRHSSISVAVVGRLKDSVNQATHEILHQFGATHNFDSCNIMGYYRECENPPILDLTLREIGL